MRQIVLAVKGSVAREGLKALFEQEGWQVNVKAQNRHQLLHELKSHIEPLVIISDSFCDHATKAVLRTINQQTPRAKIILWCWSTQNAIYHYVSDEKIHGYMYQQCDDQEWLSACALVRHGGNHRSPYLAQTFRYLGKLSEQGSPFASLSKREKLVFQLICGGNTVAEIADRLFISRKTVNTFRYRLFKKTNVVNDVQLAHLAISSGVVPLTPRRFEKGEVAVVAEG